MKSSRFRRNFNSASENNIEDNYLVEYPKTSYASIVLRKTQDETYFNSDNEVFFPKAQVSNKRERKFSIRKSQSKERFKQNNSSFPNKMNMNEFKSKAYYSNLTTDNPYSPSIIENSIQANSIHNIQNKNSHLESSYGKTRNLYEGKLF